MSASNSSMSPTRQGRHHNCSHHHSQTSAQRVAKSPRMTPTRPSASSSRASPKLRTQRSIGQLGGASGSGSSGSTASLAGLSPIKKRLSNPNLVVLAASAGSTDACSSSSSASSSTLTVASGARSRRNSDSTLRRVHSTAGGLTASAAARSAPPPAPGLIRQTATNKSGSPPRVTEEAALQAPGPAQEAAACDRTEGHEPTSPAHPSLPGSYILSPPRRESGAKAPSSRTQKVRSPPSRLPLTPASPPGRLPPTTTYDSLQELLEQAGYRETRVITPTQQSVAKKMRAQAAAQSTNLRQTHTAGTGMQDGAQPGNGHLVAQESRPLRRQASYTEGLGAAYSAGETASLASSWTASSASAVWSWIGGASWAAAPKQPAARPVFAHEVDADDSADTIGPAQMATSPATSSWISTVSMLWPPASSTASAKDGRAAGAEQEPMAVKNVEPVRVQRSPPHAQRQLRKTKSSIPDRPRSGIDQHDAPPLPAIVFDSAQTGDAQPAAPAASQDGNATSASSAPLLRKRRSKNDLWQASLALRSAEAREPVPPVPALPARSVAVVGIGGGDVLTGGPAVLKSRRSRPSLASAFKRDAATSTAEGGNTAEIADGGAQPPVPPLLVSAPAGPVLSPDVAVAPRNAACLRPRSLRKAQSIEVLRAALSSGALSGARSSAAPMQRSSSNSTTASAASGAGSPSSNAGSAASTSSLPAPVLTLTSPSGTGSPQELPLSGAEFEPQSLGKFASGASGSFGSVVAASAGMASGRISGGGAHVKEQPLMAARRKASAARKAKALRRAQSSAALGQQPAARSSALAESTNTVQRGRTTTKPPREVGDLFEAGKLSRAASRATSPKASAAGTAAGTAVPADLKLELKGQARVLQGTPPRRSRLASVESPTSVVAQSRSLRRSGAGSSSSLLRDHAVAAAATAAAPRSTHRPLPQPAKPTDIPSPIRRAIKG